MKRLYLLLFFPIAVFTQSWNTTLIANLDYSQSLNDIWGYHASNGKEYALVGLTNGTSIVDVTTDPYNPTEVAFIPGGYSTWRDIKTWDRYMYVGTEASDGIQVVNIEDPENAELVYTWTQISSSHNIHIHDGYLYIVGASGDDIHILDLSNPAQPVKVGGWNGEYIHDLYVRGDIIYACGIYSSTVYIIDVSDKSNPVTITDWSYSGMAHACWLTEDGNYLVTADETSGGYIRIWDISNYSNINQVAVWYPEGGASNSVHNVFVRDNYLYASYYVYGLQILDITDPTNPTLAGYYDTFPGNSGLYDGAWGAYPFTESCYTYVSDMVGGLYVVDFDGCVSADAALSYSPEFFDFNLDSGQSSSGTLTVTNVGEEESILYYNVSKTALSPFENTGGGPDSEGHFWSDSNMEPSIEYEWIDITATGTQISFPNNDQAADPINIGFDFPFYGESYSECIVNANGWMGFGSDNNSWDNTSIPDGSAPIPAIFGFWDDLNPVNDQCNQYCSGEVYVHSNSERFVVSFNQVAHWWTGYENSFYDFQMVLYSNGEIQVNYNEITGNHSATIGMQGENGSAGLQVGFDNSADDNNDYASNQLSLVFRQAESIDWLSLTSSTGGMNGQLEMGEAVFFTVEADADELDGGEYFANIKLNTNAEPMVVIPVNLTVSGDEPPEENVEIHTQLGWNMVGLPVDTDDNSVGALFPDAIDGTLYSYDGTYQNESELEIGKGYWLRFSTAEINSVSGAGFDEINLFLNESWNLISGTTYPSAIVDPDGIIISGTIYGYDNGYYNTTELEPGYSYWVRTSASGMITLASGTARSVGELEYWSDGVNELQFTNAQGRKGKIYFGVSIPKDEILNLSLPPVPPAGAFDIRFGGDLKIGNEGCEILIQNVEWPLNILLEKGTGNKEPGSGHWVLVDDVNGKEYSLNENGPIKITEPTDRLILYKNTLTPEHFALSQNYPNPFNPVTTINYSIEVPGIASLQIFDITGRLVETLINENMESGYHEIKWNASNVSSGVYIYKLTSGSNQITKKMILLK
tara:strand:+ start:6549 stop:9656 length:3108 start_codon:yes stop_codon:yes gene_type:complete